MQTFFANVDPSYVLLAVGALFVHACYQLSVSVLTHFGAHALSKQTSEHRLLLLGTSYGIGAVTVTTLTLVGAASLARLAGEHSPILTAVVVGVVPFIGLATVLWYYRQGEGTRLWLPRPVADYLLERSKKTSSAIEAAMLGAATVVGELPYLAGPLLFVTFLVSRQPSDQWLGWAGAYSLIAYAPLLVVTMYLTSGHSVARIQRWRETNKSFLQWTSGIALILLSIYFTVIQLGVAP